MSGPIKSITTQKHDIETISLENSIQGCTNLRVSETQRGGQLPPVGFGDVLLQLEPLLQPLALQVGEDGPRPGALPLAGTGRGSGSETGTGSGSAGREGGERALWPRHGPRTARWARRGPGIADCNRKQHIAERYLVRPPPRIDPHPSCLL